MLWLTTPTILPFPCCLLLSTGTSELNKILTLAHQSSWANVTRDCTVKITLKRPFSGIHWPDFDTLKNCSSERKFPRRFFLQIPTLAHQSSPSNITRDFPVKITLKRPFSDIYQPDFNTLRNCSTERKFPRRFFLQILINNVFNTFCPFWCINSSVFNDLSTGKK